LTNFEKTSKNDTARTQKTLKEAFMKRFHKNKMTSLLCFLLLCPLLLQAAGCKDKPAPDQPDEQTTQQENQTESQTEPTPEPVCALTLRATELTPDGCKFKLTLLCALDGDAEGEIECCLMSDAGMITNQTIKAQQGELTVTLDCPEERVNDALLLVVNATDAAGVAADALEIPIKNGLVQLSPDSIDCVVAAMTLDEKAHMVTGTQNVVLPGASGGTYAIERLGVPSVTVNDGPAGLRYDTTVWYPSVINLSSSWDASLASQIGVAMGKDCLVKSVDVILAPGMNIQKNVLGGRKFEYCFKYCCRWSKLGEYS
jgi:hypothetical protein